MGLAAGSSVIERLGNMAQDPEPPEVGHTICTGSKTKYKSKIHVSLLPAYDPTLNCPIAT